MTDTLNKERVELFLAALESGEYTKCTGALRQQVVPLETMVAEQHHCALGVATDVALNNGLREELGKKFGGDVEDALFSSGALYGVVVDWYGFDDDDPNLGFVTDDGEPVSVAVANDIGHTFWDIAQMGRARWLKDQE